MCGSTSLKNKRIAPVPDVESGFCLGSEGNGVSMGEGGKGEPGPPEEGIDKQLMTNKGRNNMGKERRINQVGRDEGGSARTE